MTRRQHVPRWAYAPAAAGLAVVVIPLVALLPRVNWSTFVQDITEPTTLAALLLSTKSAVIAVLICVMLGVPLALLIARAPRRLAALLRTIVTLPLVLPPLVGGVALLAVLGRTGLIGPWLENLGVAIPFTPAAVVVAQTFVALPFLVIAVEGALRSAGTQYEQVAAGLGAGRTRVLLRITLPLIMPGLLAGIVLTFARSVGEFGATALLAGNRPGSTQTIPMAIYTAFNGVGASRQAAMALSVLLIATSLVVLLAFPVARGATGHRAGGHAQDAPEIDVPAPGGKQAPAKPGAPAPANPGAPGRGAPLTLDVEFTRPGFDLRAQIDLPPASVLAVVGPNAAGKTTLLDLIAGNLTPNAGTVRLGEQMLSAPHTLVPPRRRRMGILSQQPLLFPHLSVLENVAFGPRSAGEGATEARERARELLAHVGMAGTEGRMPAQLSGGQQQRVALARALATEPEVLLLDEPLAAMDVSTAPAIRATLAAEIARTKVSAIIITHNVLDVLALAHRVVVLERGRVVENLPVEEFLTRPTSSFGALFTGINVLRDPVSGDLLHLRDDELVVASAHDPSEPGWQAVVEHVTVAGTRAFVRAVAGGRAVIVASDVAAVADLLPGQTVHLRRQEVGVEA